MSNDWFALVAAMAFVIMVVSGTVALGQTNTAPISGDVVLSTNSQMKMTVESQAVNGQLPTSPFTGSDQITIQKNQFTGSDREYRLTAVNESFGKYRWTNITQVSNGAAVEIDTALSTPTVEFNGTVTDLAVADNFDFAQTGSAAELVASATGSWSLRVNDTGVSRGRGIVIENNDTGEILAGDSVDANGDAVLDGIPSVQNAELDIRQGPSDLKVFLESQPNTKATNVNLRVRVFEQGSDNVFQRSVTNGELSLIDVPPDKPISVTVASDDSDFAFRRTIIQNVATQEEVYLLNETLADTATVVFELEDRTDEFPARSSQLIIEKPINKDFNSDGTNTTRYQQIAGDTFGGTSEFQTVLEQNERYRLRVTNGQQTRILGAYVAKIDDRTTIRIGEVNFDIPETSGFAADLEGIEQSGSEFVRFKFRDPGGRTQSLSYEIVNDETGNVLTSVNDAGLGTHVNTVSVPSSAPLSNTTYRVDYNIVRTQDDGTTETLSSQKYAGDLSGFGNQLPIDSFWGGIIGLIGIVAIGGLGAIFSPAIGAVGAVVSAALLGAIGLVSIPGAAIGLASAVTVLAIVGRQA